MNIQRWCFTRKELLDISACRAKDEFFADAGPDDELNVIVYRDGSVSNQWSDGTAGVGVEARDYASEDESPMNRDGELADTWMDVIVENEIPRRFNNI